MSNATQVIERAYSLAQKLRATFGDAAAARGKEGLWRHLFAKGEKIAHLLEAILVSSHNVGPDFPDGLEVTVEEEATGCTAVSVLATVTVVSLCISVISILAFVLWRSHAAQDPSEARVAAEGDEANDALLTARDRLLESHRTNLELELSHHQDKISTQRKEINSLREQLEGLSSYCYALSLIPRFLGCEKGTKPIDILRNAVFGKYDLPEGRKDVVEPALGISAPVNWILTAKEADSFIKSYFPGLATTLEWQHALPGTNPDGNLFFQQVINRQAGTSSFNSPRLTKGSVAGFRAPSFPLTASLPLTHLIDGEDIELPPYPKGGSHGPATGKEGHEVRTEHENEQAAVLHNQDQRIGSLREPGDFLSHTPHQDDTDDSGQRQEVALARSQKLRQEPGETLFSWHERCKEELIAAEPHVEVERSITPLENEDRDIVNLVVYEDTDLMAHSDTSVSLSTEDGSSVGDSIAIGRAKPLPRGVHQVYPCTSYQARLKMRQSCATELTGISPLVPITLYAVTLTNFTSSTITLRKGESYHLAYQLTDDVGQGESNEREKSGARQMSTISVVGRLGPYTPGLAMDHPLWKLGNRQMLKSRPFPIWGKPLDAVDPTNDPLDFCGRAKLLVNYDINSLDECSCSISTEGQKQFKLSFPYLMVVYSTDQDVECELSHENCKVCCKCLRWVICWRKQCRVCNNSVRITLADILDEDQLHHCNPEHIRDVLYHRLVLAGKPPGAAYARYPVHRVNNWDKDACVNLGANKFFNRILPCDECHGKHPVVFRKWAPAHFLPHEQDYYTVTKARTNGVTPYMMYGYKADRMKTNNWESIAECPDSKKLSPIGTRDTDPHAKVESLFTFNQSADTALQE